MPAVKPIAMVVDKWTRRASAAGQDYSTGVQNTQPSTWETNTGAAQQSWSTGVAQAAASGRFASGVQGKGQKWQRKATTVGAQRFSAGVSAAAGDYQAAVQPYLDTISSVTLTPRGPRGDPNNLNRVAAIATALHRRRVGGAA